FVNQKRKVKNLEQIFFENVIIAYAQEASRKNRVIDLIAMLNYYERKMPKHNKKEIMGQCLERQQVVLDQQVQQELEADKVVASKRFKLLLLGAGNIGKSTFFKQLCQIHGEGLDEDDKLHGARYIHDSIIHQMKNIIEACIDEFKYEHIKTLWADDAIKKAFCNRTNLGIVDSCPYFFDNIERIGVNDYEPTEEDILLARIPTTGIRESTFKVKENTFDLFDVGGQRSERSKWIHCFDNVNAVLFVASLNCYDQNLFEDEDVNAMDESLGLFNEVINSRF
ncbi:hypothetical protein RFI_36602, partial [Reticulomyxa filosa]